MLKYAGRPTPKMIKKKSWSRKTAIDVKYIPCKLKGNAERQRERKSKHRKTDR